MPLERKITVGLRDGAVMVSEFVGGEWYREFFTDRDSLLIYAHKEKIEIDVDAYFPCELGK